MQTRKNANGTWNARIYLGTDAHGKRIYKSFTAPTQKEAKTLAERYAVDYEREYKYRNNPADYLTLGEAMDRFIHDPERDLSPNTIYGYEIIKRNYFLDLQEILLSKITLEMVLQSLEESCNRPSKKSGKPLSQKTMQNVIGFVKVVFKEYYPQFPAERVKLTRAKKAKLSKKRESVLHDIEDICRMIYGTDIELPVLLGVLSFRAGEVLGFRKCDCDLEHGYITVNQTQVDHGNRIYKEDAKTEKSKRTLKLPLRVIELIKELPPEQEYLVTMREHTLYRHWIALQEKYGCTDIMTFHDLRHVHATLTNELVMSQEVRMELGGWNSSIIDTVYTDKTVSLEKREAEENKLIYLLNRAIKKAI